MELPITGKEKILSDFKKYAALMKASQDKYERLFKLRRDITIESKRVIFLLHSIDNNDKKAGALLMEAEKRLNALRVDPYSAIDKELKGEDPYRYYRAVSSGNQEYIEALTLLEYIRDSTIKTGPSELQLPFAPTLDYALGIADLTGELMRRCVSAVTSGRVAEVAPTCDFLRKIYTEMICLPHRKDLGGKLPTVHSNLMKVERICYNLHVLGGEVPQHVLTCDGEPEFESTDAP